MKYLLFLLLCLPCLVISQSTGRIAYDEKMDLHRNLPPEREDFKDMIPQYNVSKWELIYQGDESVYQAEKQEELEFSNTQGPNHMTMRFGGRANRVLYKHLGTDAMTDSRDFMQKQFLIKGPPTPRKWKIGKKSKNILGYHCLEASFVQDTATSVTAWFAPQLQPANGPADYQGLPGMILEIDINQGERTITATAITTENVDTSAIVAPTKGKEVTAEEFKQIQEEKMKEMGMQGPGRPGGQQMMIIRSN